MAKVIKCKAGVLPPKSVELGIAEVEIILNTTRETVRSLSASGRLKRKQSGKKFIYDCLSVEKYMATFNKDDFYTVAEATQVLKDNGISDEFESFSSGGIPANKCKYKRYTNEFPISVKQLLKRGYLFKDKNIKPVLITKKSMVETIKKLSNRVPANNTAPATMKVSA